MFISRFGWMAEKVGMTTILLDGKMQGVTLLKIFRQNILGKSDKDDHCVLKVGVETNKLRSKPQIIELTKLNKPLCKLTKEFKITKDEMLSLENEYGIELFENNIFVDVSANGIGKGFAGCMKRWNFQGAGASHGTSLTHRAIGSTGTRDKMFKGKKMPGRLGGKRITIQNLKVCSVDSDLGVIALLGSVPGKAGTFVEVKKAIKKNRVRQ